MTRPYRPPSNLYKVVYRGAAYYVEAEDFGAAVTLWAESDQAPHDVEEPDRVLLVSRDPVIRRPRLELEGPRPPGESP